MEENEFLKRVQRRAGLATVEEARTVTATTLQVFGEAVGEGTAGDVAAELPEAFAGSVTVSTGARRYDPREFVERVRTNEHTADVDETDAERHAKAGLSTLADAVSGGTLADARDRLPDGYARLFDPPDAPEPVE